MSAARFNPKYIGPARRRYRHAIVVAQLLLLIRLFIASANRPLNDASNLAINNANVTDHAAAVPANDNSPKLTSPIGADDDDDDDDDNDDKAYNPLDCSPFQALLIQSNSTADHRAAANLTTNCACTYDNKSGGNYPALHFVADSSISHKDGEPPMIINVKCGYDRAAPNSTTIMSLREIHLRNANLGGDLRWLAAMAAGSNRRIASNDLIHIDLSHNGFGGSIPSQVWTRFPRLRYLNLSFNRLEGSIEPYDHDITIATSYGRDRSTDSSNSERIATDERGFDLPSRLRSLDVSNNDLSGRVYMGNHRVAGFMAQLAELNVSHNRIEVMNASREFIIRFHGLSSFLPNLNCTGWCTNSSSADTHNSPIAKYGHRSRTSKLPRHSSEEEEDGAKKMMGRRSSADDPSSKGDDRNADDADARRRRRGFTLLADGRFRGAIIGAIALVIAACLAAAIRSRRTIRSAIFSRRCTIASLSAIESTKSRELIESQIDSKSATKKMLPHFFYNAGTGSSIAAADARSIGHKASYDDHRMVGNDILAIAKDPESVPVVIFRKPLLGFTLADLLRARRAADSHAREDRHRHGIAEPDVDAMGAESVQCQRSYFECALPGVLDGRSAASGGELAIELVALDRVHRAASHEQSLEELLGAMGEIRHENLEPLLGYCIVGSSPGATARKMLMIYEHVEGARSLEDLILIACPEDRTGGSASKADDDWSAMDTWDRCRDLTMNGDSDGDGDCDDHGDGNDDAGAVRKARRNLLSRLGWEGRVKIAVGVARALAYLHARQAVHGALSAKRVMIETSSSPSSTYRDRSAQTSSGGQSDDIADAPDQAPVSVDAVRVIAHYGGLGHYLGEDTATSTVSSRSAYRAPECPGASCTAARCAEPTCDVYSAGVLMMELASGTLSSSLDSTGIGLVDRVRAAFRNRGFCDRAGDDDDAIGSAIDPALPRRLRVLALRILHVAYLCTARSASKRPSAHQLVGLLRDLQQHPVPS